VASGGDGELELAIDGCLRRFPAVWLRDNCRCVQCLDPGTGQKLHDITDIPEDLTVAATEDTGESVAITYAPDGHRSVFSRSWLARHAPAEDGDQRTEDGDQRTEGGDQRTEGGDQRTEDGDQRTEDGKDLWLAADLDPEDPRRRPEGSWPRYLAEPAERARCLDAVLRQGFVLLHDVPAENGMVLEVAASFGYVRETNYGRLFDVRVEPSPDNLAYTSREILPHTDNPYRDPVPTIQLLHCLRTADDGGDTGLVDGFCAAAALRAADADAFELLTRNPVSFGYQDKGAELQASQPLIELSARGRVRGVRFNNRSALPLRLPYAELARFYPAYRRWAELLARPERRLNLRLAPGDCLVFDNTRILHARTAFSMSQNSAGRHLQGCYADLDGLASTLAVLRRTTGAEREERP
jgi:gamma-butyrobetaine dioxygenase